VYGLSAMQGWRISMEDAHTAVLNLLEDNPKAAKEHPSKLSFFGVFDGHGGSNVALFAGDNIHRIVAKQDTFKAGNYEQALKDGFLATDRAILNGMLPPDVPADAEGRGDESQGVRDRPAAATTVGITRALRHGSLTWIFRADPKYEEEVSGCTACVGLITDDKIYIVGPPLTPFPPWSPAHPHTSLTANHNSLGQRWRLPKRAWGEGPS
jgi:protein phosphatase 2C family protein 2/3